MALLVRIKLPNRSEYRKVIRTKKDNFVLLGDNYNIDFNSAYITGIYGGLVKIQCLDYEKGYENPIQYFNRKEGDFPKTKHKAHHVAEVIRRLIEEIPHFQLIVIIMLIIAMGIAGVAAYLAYDAGSKAENAAKLVYQFYSYYLNMTNMSGYP